MKILAPVLLLALTACASVDSDDGRATASFPANPAAEAQFEALKGMAGTWMTTDATDEEPARIDYRVSGGGSAVVETLFPDTEHEMVSVYTLDAGQVHMTHYCMMGNQPHMVASPAKDAARIEFVCQGGGNIPNCRVDHMHAGTFTFRDASHVDAEWTSYSDGAVAHRVVFQLERR